MVGMHVRHDDAQKRKTFELVGKDLLPLRFRLLGVDAAIDDAPAGSAIDFIAQQPQIDVIECKRQGHAQPLHTGGNTQAGTRRWQGITERVVQLLFKFVDV